MDLLPCRQSRISAKARYPMFPRPRMGTDTIDEDDGAAAAALVCAPASMRSIDGGRGVLLSCVVETRLVLVDDGREARETWFTENDVESRGLVEGTPACILSCSQGLLELCLPASLLARWIFLIGNDFNFKPLTTSSQERCVCCHVPDFWYTLTT